MAVNDGDTSDMKVETGKVAGKWQGMSSLFQRVRAAGFAPLVTGILLVAIGLAAASLVPGSPMDGLSRAHVASGAAAPR